MPHSRSGFTLLEILVVLVIVGVLVTAATLSVSSSEGEQVRQERQRLQALVLMLRDEAVFQSRSFGIRFVENGYAFLALSDEDGQWQGVADQQLRPRELPESMILAVSREGVDLDLSVPENDDEEEPPPIIPHVFVLSSGEMSAFEVELVYPSRGREQLRFDALGNAEVLEQ